MTVHQFKPTQNIKLSPINVSTPQSQPNSLDKISRSSEDQPIDDRFTLADLLQSEKNVDVFNGYLIEKRHRNGDDSFFGIQEYVSISKKGTRPIIFDAKIDHPAGNSADFEWVTLLGSSAHQLAVSQEIGRTGAQWIVDFSPNPRVIFDGKAWRVGRESDDCEIEDLDGDGKFEISLPITDFYSFMDKMAVAAIPLPMITFKYDPAKKKYVPINHLLSEPNKTAESDLFDKSDPHFVRAILGHVLELIYQGKRDQAWQDFNATYNLDDKKEFERRVKEILSRQPIYKYIYKKRQTH